MPTRFFLYARKSSDSEERQVLSIEAQITELRTFAQGERLQIAREFTEAMTAKDPGRPVFNKMLARLENGEAEGILAWHPDRLARNSVDGGRIIHLLDRGVVKALKFPTFWFESTPQGKFMLNIAFGQSKYFSDNLSENVKRGLRQKLRRGEWPAVAPLGYVHDSKLRQVVFDPKRAPLVRRLFDVYAAGHYSMETLRIEAERWGLTTRRNRPLVKAEVNRILVNPFFYGLMKFGGETHQGKHPPLITKTLFDQVQAVMEDRSRPHTRHKGFFPLLGLATCGHCGGSITAERQKNFHYYRCTKKRGPCPEKYIREENLAEQIRAAVRNVALPSDGYQFMLAELAKEQGDSTRPVGVQKKSELEEQIAGISVKLDRLVDAHLDGIIDRPTYLFKKEQLLNERADLEGKKSAFESTPTSRVENIREFLEAAHQADLATTGSDLSALRNFFHQICSNARLAGKTLNFSYGLPWAALKKSRGDKNWRPRRDSNPCYRRERAMSWTGLDDGDALRVLK